MTSLISADNAIGLWFVIIGFVFFAMFAERHYKWARAVGACLICLIGGMLLSTSGLMPATSGVYDAIWSYVTPAAIPLVLFKADVRRIGKECGKMLFMFLSACCGTMLGAVIASCVLHGHISEFNKCAAMFTSSQTGGTMNMIVMGEVFDISKNMFNAVYLADTITFAFTLFTLTLLPSMGFIRKHFRASYPILTEEEIKQKRQQEMAEGGFDVYSIAKSLTISLCIVFVSTMIADFVSGLEINEVMRQLFGQKYLVLTAITVILATAFPRQLGTIRGSQEMGLFLMYIFFVVISTEANLREILTVGPALILFSFIMFLSLVTVSLVFGKIFQFSLEEISVSANAALGGPSTAAAAAVAKGWTDLVTPGVLLGTLGYILGNYFGVFIGNFVLKLFGV